MRNRAKESTAKDVLGLMGVILSILLLMYLLIENYMGYTGLKRLLSQDKHVPVKQMPMSKE